MADSPPRAIPTSAPATAPAVNAQVAREIDALADDAWAWFLRYTHPKTGLTLDGGANSADAAAPAPDDPTTTQASIAATGFYLGLLAAAVTRGQLGKDDAHARALQTLRFARHNIDHVRGVMLHFVHSDTGARFGQSEYSVLDTAIFLHGAIVAGQAFGGDVANIADEMLDRVEWDRLLTEHKPSDRPIMSYGFGGDDRALLPHGADVRSSENLMPLVLAAGSRTHPVDKSCWYNMAVNRNLRVPLHGWTPPPDLAHVLNPSHGLFTAYYGLCWMNLRGLHDADGLDLWSNARTAALFNRQACRQVWAERFQTYRPANGGWWGLSAGDGPSDQRQRHSTYTVPNPIDGDRNGTVWPTAALGAFPWIPAELSQDLPNWRASPWWPRCRGRYGLASFSIDRDWVSGKLLGIDVGSFLLNWWNARLGTVHKLWWEHPVPRQGLHQLEFSHP